MVYATPATGFEGPLAITDHAAVAELRVVLGRHGFAGSAVPDALGSALPVARAHLRDDLPLYLRRLQAATPINTLVKLFVLDQAVSAADAAAAFAPLPIARVARMGLLREVPGGVRARMRLSGYDGLILAHDGYDEEKRSLRPDHVLDVNPTTISLSNLTVRRRVGRALEIGTGCGALALKASRHAERVVATDTNTRALNFAAFNAAINGITNVEWRLGSLFDAVAGERFDLIFSNPPYVISPDSTLIFRDGGRRGDSLCEEIVRRAPAHLEDGGFATVLINWGIRQGDEWSAPLRRWAEGNGCDTWLMLSAAQDPTTYAAIWNRSRDRAAYTAGLERWIEYFEELGLAAIGLGAVVLRRRSSGPTWIRADQLPDSVKADAGPHLERLFESQDRLAAVADNESLLAQRFEIAPNHQLRQVLTARDGAFAVDAAEILLHDGLPFHGSVDAFATQLLARCDGRRRLADIAAQVASEAGADQARFAAACADIARRLIASGFLVPPAKTPAVGSSPERLEGSV